MTQCLEILKDVVIGLITGVSASLAYERMVAARRFRELKAQFGGLQGQYTELRKEIGARSTTTGGTVMLTYGGRAKLISNATNAEGKQVWHGELFMRENEKVLGEGFYSYDGQDNAGVHRVFYNPELKQFDVSGENTSHPEGVKDFKMVWKRK